MPASCTHSDLDIAAEVADALESGQPVVALESTIISHGMPPPDNLDTALRSEEAVRAGGAVPATIAVLDGRLRVGLGGSELERLAAGDGNIAKASRRDLAILMATGGSGATTVAATMIVAALAGIRVFATGGIGGVHRGAESSMDISADLEELGRSNVAVVCSGIKSVLDIPRTLEYLETLGVPVLGYGTDRLPEFYVRGHRYSVDHRVDDAATAAAIMHARWRLPIAGGIVIANPVPREFALDPADIDGIVDDALAAAGRENIAGKDVTPFLLARIAERSSGRSLRSNIELVCRNAAVAAAIAVAYAQLDPAATGPRR